ncbi:zinc finger protein [Sesbania bispinosa]|nr:zinc finger protein [Sesbania bispinosa]
MDSNSERKWDDNTLLKEEVDASCTSKKEAILKRERIKEYSFNHRRSAESERSKVNGRWRGGEEYGGRQLRMRITQRQSPVEGLDSPIRKSFPHHRRQCSVGEEPKMSSRTMRKSKLKNLRGDSEKLLSCMMFQDNVRAEWTGKSLEGSAVREPAPLDMSEEAQAERWFHHRVAQIKDIYELSEITDEDFPSIMLVRKGVNILVVSKRKTSLEKRLTSQQYRRNLPI